MSTIRANFDGEKIVLPDAFHGLPPQEVIVIYKSAEDDAWVKAQEASFAKAWDNDEDAVYDSL